MRRIFVHAIAGVAVILGVALVTGLSLAGGGSAVSTVPATSEVPGPLRSVHVAVQEAMRASRAQSRDEARHALSERAAVASARRQQTLTTQSQAVAARQVVLKKRAEIKRKKAAAAAAKRKRFVAQHGYVQGTTDPRSIARQILQNKYGYGAGQYSCFNNIIMRESMWDVRATNRSSGAYGIPQALPGSKMASVASDWRTNPATQITWAIGYMKNTYGSPCGAWGFKSSHGWY